jgi:hypothetical protein
MNNPKLEEMKMAVCKHRPNQVPMRKLLTGCSCRFKENSLAEEAIEEIRKNKL